MYNISHKVKKIEQKCKNMSKIAIAMGGNLGNTTNLFDLAVNLLINHGVQNPTVAPIITTKPVDCLPDTPEFQNTALVAEYFGTPEELLTLCQAIEQQLGRPANHGHNTSRTIDLDIITFDSLTLNTPTLTLPHPRATQREFVLQPLSVIAPEWKINNLTVTEWLAKLS